MTKNNLPGNVRRFARYFVFAVLPALFIIAPGQTHARVIGVAVIETGEVPDADRSLNRLFKDELTALFKGEHDVKFTIYKIKKDASPADTNALLERAYDDPGTDMVLVLDVAANQVIGRRPSFAKPTFLPLVINGRLLGYPVKGRASGRKNLNYQTRELDFEEELKILRAIAPFRRAVLISDARIRKSIGPAMIAATKALAEKAGVELSIKTYNGNPRELLSGIPEGTDAVLYGAIPTAGRQEMKSIIEGVNAKGIPSFSLGGEAYVRLGALATNNPDTDWEKLARRTAIHMQEMFLGTPASSLPVFFESTGRLMINMETSRRIRYAPGFDVLSEATLINEDKASADVGYSLADVARKAVQANLSLVARRLPARRLMRVEPRFYPGSTPPSVTRPVRKPTVRAPGHWPRIPPTLH